MSDGKKQEITDWTGGRLGRHVFHDPGNRNFPARGVLFAKKAKVVTRTWVAGHLFDQEYTSSCAMQSAAGLLYTQPFSSRVAPQTVRAYNQHHERVAGYKRAQAYDPWPGTSYDGTSTDAPLRMLRAEKRIKEWRWCFGLQDVLLTLSNWGPVTLGVNWHDAMFTPEPDGRIRPVSSVMGGHCVELLAVNVEESKVWGINSWGLWGPQDGYFYLTFGDLESLLAANGEAATITP